MKLMNDKLAFFDTNILVYAFSDTEIDKQQISRNILSTNESVISTQVLQELANILIRKFKIDYPVIIETIKECIQNSYKIHLNDENTILKACQLGKRYQFSFYDSLIIAAALKSKCKILYSEDLQHQQTIESLKIINPFL